MVKRPKVEQIEGNYLILGLYTFLNQFHEFNKDIFTGLMAHYIRSGLNFVITNKEVQ